LDLQDLVIRLWTLNMDINMQNVTNITGHKNGQALLFVLVAVSVAMVVGVSVSNRALSSIRRTTTTDTFSRVLGAAEGCIERSVAVSDDDLDDLMDAGPTTTECQTAFGGDSSVTEEGGKCKIPYSSDEETVELYAYASFLYASEEEYKYFGDVIPGMAREVALENYDGGSVDVCWKNGDTALYLVLYSQDDIARFGLQPNGFGLGTDAFKETGTTTVNLGGTDHDLYCAEVDFSDYGVSNSYGLRVKTLYETSDVYVLSEALTGGTHMLPNQGFEVNCIAELTGASEQKITKEIKATKSLPFMPSVFDFAVYTHTGSVTKL
jgi:hypothetical protein